MSLELITKEVAEIKSGLDKTIKDTVNSVVAEKANELEAKANAILEKVKGEGIDKAEYAKALEDIATITKDFEAFQLEAKQGKFEGKKTFNAAMSELLVKNADAISKVRKGNGVKLELDLKAVAVMTNSNNLTGDGVVSYNPRQAILPGTAVNFRDLIPTNNSGTLVSVQYMESAGEGSITAQTEGSAKSQIDFDFTEVKTTTKYVSGFARFSKQILKNVPWLGSTLPRLLSREFYNAENAAFYTTVIGAATGSTTTSETNDILQLMDYLANQRIAKFTPSYVLVNHAKMAGLNKRAFATGYYQGAGGVLSQADGSLTIGGTPVIPVDWVLGTRSLVIDNNYLERVEAESLMIELFEQDNDNVQKNLITARIECLEEINPMLPASIIYADLGAAS